MASCIDKPVLPLYYFMCTSNERRKIQVIRVKLHNCFFTFIQRKNSVRNFQVLT